jgi:hypothetical protein
MQADPSPLRLSSEDVATHRAVLGLALAAYPKSLTIPGLAAEVGRAEHAVRDLVAVGLLICGGLSVEPSPAAVHFDRLGL